MQALESGEKSGSTSYDDENGSIPPVDIIVENVPAPSFIESLEGGSRGEPRRTARTESTLEDKEKSRREHLASRNKFLSRLAYTGQWGCPQSSTIRRGAA